MGSVFGPIILGIFISILGIFNTKGHISSIHRYHRHRVTEENRLPFGKLVGLGTIICGVSMIVFGGFELAAELLENPLFTLIGSVLLGVSVVVGVIIMFYAMIKYNKGIF